MNLPTPEQIAGLDDSDHVTAAYKEELIRRARANLFFFAKYCFGRHGLNERAHRPLCDAAQDIIVKPNAFGVFEDPRATGKSNAITIPGPAWCLIQDEKECERRGWLPLGPNATIIVVSYKTPIAAIFVDETRRTMEGDAIFGWLFGHLIPERRHGEGIQWAKESFTVNRTGGVGPSVAAMGTESGSTSLHPLVAFIDDLINEINYKSPTEVQTQVEWMEHSLNLTDTMRGSRVLTENSWTERDVNFSIREQNKRNPKSVFFFSRSRVVCDLCARGRKLDQYGNPIPCGEGFEHPLPARPLLDNYVSRPYGPYTMDDVRTLYAKLPSQIRWAQHENNPLARADLKWREEWLRYFTIENDPAGGDQQCAVLVGGVGGLSGNKHEVDPSRLVWVPISSMTVTVALDPGIHHPGICAVGRTRVNGFGDMAFILDTSTEPLTPRDQFFRMFDWLIKWGATRLAFENVGLQAYIEQTIPAMAEAYVQETGRQLPYWVRRPNREAGRIVGVQVYKREGDKVARLDSGLSPFAEQRLLAVQRRNRAFIDEYVIFDKGKYMDGLDATLMGIKAGDPNRKPTADEKEKVRHLAIRSKETYEQAHQGAVGYGEGV